MLGCRKGSYDAIEVILDGDFGQRIGWGGTGWNSRYLFKAKMIGLDLGADVGCERKRDINKASLKGNRSYITLIYFLASPMGMRCCWFWLFLTSFICLLVVLHEGFEKEQKE